MKQLDEFTVRSDTRETLQGDHKIGELTIESAPFYPHCLPKNADGHGIIPEKFHAEQRDREEYFNAMKKFGRKPPYTYLSPAECYWISSCLSTKGVLEVDRLNMGDRTTIDVGLSADKGGGVLTLGDNAKLDMTNFWTTLRAQRKIDYPEELLSPTREQLAKRYSADLLLDEDSQEVVLTQEGSDRLLACLPKRVSHKGRGIFKASNKKDIEENLKRSWGVLVDYHQQYEGQIDPNCYRLVEVESPHVNERYETYNGQATPETRMDPRLWESSWVHPTIVYDAMTNWLDLESDTKMRELHSVGSVGAQTTIREGSSISLGLVDHNKVFRDYDFVNIDRLLLGEKRQILGNEIDIRSLRQTYGSHEDKGIIMAGRNIHIGHYFSPGHEPIRFGQLATTRQRKVPALEITVDMIRREHIDIVPKKQRTGNLLKDCFDSHGGRFLMDGKDVHLTINGSELPYEICQRFKYRSRDSNRDIVTDCEHLSVTANHRLVDGTTIQADEIHLNYDPKLFKGDYLRLEGRVYVNGTLKYPDGYKVNTKDIAERRL